MGPDLCMDVDHTMLRELKRHDTSLCRLIDCRVPIMLSWMLIE